MKPEIINVAQGEAEWLKMRLGVITASCAHGLIPTITETEAKISKRDGRILKPAQKKVTFKKARQNYMTDLISEVCTGKGEEINAKALEWGKVNEAAARAAYEFETNESILPGGFIYNLDRRVGASPDGIVKGKNKGLELKCPFSSSTHIDSILYGAIKDEYITQVQWSMWVTGFDEWAFASFDPRMKSQMIYIEVIKRDENMMNLFNEIVPVFIKEMDAQLEKLGIAWGSQWA